LWQGLGLKEINFIIKNGKSLEAGAILAVTIEKTDEIRYNLIECFFRRNKDVNSKWSYYKIWKKNFI
jgi:hypothetical protein